MVTMVDLLKPMLKKHQPMIVVSKHMLEVQTLFIWLAMMRSRSKSLSPHVMYYLPFHGGYSWRGSFLYSVLVVYVGCFVVLDLTAV